MKKANWFSLFVLSLGLWGALPVTAQTVTNFMWFNSTDFDWNNVAVWTNGVVPDAGGSTNYTIILRSGAAVNSLNDLGTAANNGFILNQLVSDASSAGVTLSGSNLIFKTGVGGVTPQLLQNSANGLSISNGVALSNNLTFGGTGAGVVLLLGGVSGSGNITNVNAVDKVVLVGAGVTNTGSVIINAGYLVFSNATSFFGVKSTNTVGTSQVLNIASGATGEFAMASGNTWALGSLQTNIISGNGTLAISGTGGSLYLGNAANLKVAVKMGSGALINLLGGTLRNGGNQGGLWTDGSMWTNLASMNIASGAVLDMWDGNIVYIDALTGAGTVDKGYQGVQTLAVGANNGSGVFTGLIRNNIANGSNNIMKLGSGTETLAGTNLYGGTTVINGGALQFTGYSALGGLVTVNSGSAQFSGTTILTNTATANNGGSLVFNGGSFTSVVGATGRSLNVTTNGVIVISNGATVVLGGTIGLGATAVGSYGTLNLSSGTLVVNGAETAAGYRSLTIGEWPSAIGSTFNQSGGAFYATNGLVFLPWNATNNSVWNMTGGSAMTRGIAFGQGVANQTGILNLYGGILSLGSTGMVAGAAGAGTVNLGGGTLTAYTNWGSTVAVNLTNVNGTVVIDPGNYFIALTGGVYGASGLTKNGAGDLMLGGALTYAGPTVVNTGTLVLAPTGSVSTLNGVITSANAVVINGSGVVVLGAINALGNGLILSNGEAGFSMAGNVGGSGSALTFAGGGVQVLGNTLHSLNAFNVNWSTFTGVVDVASPFNLVNVSSNISGAGGFTKQGKGFLTLQNTNSYTGGTLVSGGTLRLGAGSNTLAASGPLTVVGDTLDLAGNTVTLAGQVSFQGGTVQNGTLVSTTSNFDARAGVVAANLQGAVGLLKSTLGTVTLLGGNTYSGGTTINTGTLAIVKDANVGAITFSGGMLQILGSGVDLNNHAINWSSLPYGSGFDIANTGLVQVLNNSIGGSSSLTKAGGGTLVLAIDNSYTGPTIINGGVLRLGNGGASGSVGTGNITNNSGAGALTFNRSDTRLVTNTIVGGGGLYVKSGTVVFSNNAVTLGTGTSASYIGNAPSDVAKLIVAGNAVLSGSASGAAGGLLVGNSGMGTLIVKDNASVSQRLGVGGAAGSVGVVYQLGGAVTSLGGSGADAGVGGYYNGGTYGAYGYYGLSGGVLTNSNYFQIGGYGLGVVYNLGGAMVQNGQPLEIARNGTGVVYFAGNSTYTSTQSIQIGGGSGSTQGVAIMTVAGNAVVSAGQVQMGASSQRLAILNLDGGVLQASQITKNNAATLGLVNFDGGTLRATAAGNLFNTGANAPNGVYVFSGGAVLDSSNFAVTVSQNLLAPIGSGVVNIAFSGPLAGYAGAPLVNITGGGGTGATAVALFDYASQTVTGLVITSHGYGYTAAPTVMLMGGGNSNVTLGVAGLGANTSGALTKTGSGWTQLTGTNTYAGGTLINDGVLGFASTSAIPVSSASGGITINSGGALVVTGAYSSVAGWLGSGKITTNSTGALALGAGNASDVMDFTVAGGGVYSNLFIGALSGSPLLLTGTLKFYNDDYKLGGGGGTLVVTNNLSGNSLTVGQAGTTATNTVYLEGANTFSGATLNSNAVLSISSTGNIGGNTLLMSGGTLQIRGSGLTSLPFNPVIPGNLSFDVNYAGNTFNVASNLNLGGSLTKLGLGTLVLSGSNTINNGNVVIGSGALRLQNSNALGGVTNLVVVSGAAELQLSGGITLTNNLLAFSGGGAWLNDGALRNVGGTNTWAGLIVQNGSTRYNSDSGKLILSGIINDASGNVVVGGNSETLISGAITNSGALAKDGAGRLTLTGSNLFTGTTTLNAGTLALDFSVGGAPVNNIIVTNSILHLAGGMLQVISASSGVNTQQFNGTALDGNLDNVAVITTPGGSGVLALGALTRNNSATLNLTLPSSGAITTTTGTNTVGAFDPWITVGGTNWAAVSGTTIVGLSVFSNVTSVIPNTNVMNARILAGANATITLATNANTAKTLLINDPGTAHVIDLGGTANSLTMGNPGGILLANGSAGLTIGTTINQGSLKSTGELFLDNFSTSIFTVNSALSNGANALTFSGTGAFVLNGANNYSGATVINGTPQITFNNTNSLGVITQRGGTLTFAAGSSNAINGNISVGGSMVAATMNIYGPTVLGANNTITIGSASFDRSLVNVSSSVTVSQIMFGATANAAGALYQSGGVLNQTAGANLNDFQLGSGANGYGYYKITGGTLISSEEEIGGNGGGYGVFEMFGGTVSNRSYFLIGRSGGNTGAGVVNVFGGVLDHSAANNNFAMAWNNTNGIYSVLNISNALVNVGNPNATYSTIDLDKSGTGNIGILNLNGGGTAIVSRIIATTPAGNVTVVNFNGGVLQAFTNTAAGQSLIQGVSGAYIYSGGAGIDTGTNNVTISQNLAGPTGYGLASIGVGNGGSGYIGEPLIKITGGNGTGATAVA